MASNVGNYKIVYDDEDDEHKELVQKFIEELRERIESWGFKDTDERLELTWFNQLHDDLENTNVTIVVILPNHDKRTKANYASQSALMKAIRNEEKCLIPICLNGGKSRLFDIYRKLEFQEEADWKKPNEWERLKKVSIYLMGQDIT